MIERVELQNQNFSIKDSILGSASGFRVLSDDHFPSGTRTGSPSCINISKISIHCDNKVLCGPRNGVTQEAAFSCQGRVVVCPLKITGFFWKISF